MSNTEELRNLITKIQNVTKQTITETHKMPRPAGVDTIYSGPEGWVKQANTPEAAQYLSRGTSWDIAGPTRSYHTPEFWQHNKGVFIIYDKASAKRFAVAPNGNYCVDQTDRQCQVPSWAARYVPAKQTSNDTDYDINENELGSNEARPKRYLGIIDLDDPAHADLAGLVDRAGIQTTPHREQPPAATPLDLDDPAHADLAAQMRKYDIKENKARGSSQGKLNIQMTPQLQALMRKYGV